MDTLDPRELKAVAEARRLELEALSAIEAADRARLGELEVERLTRPRRRARGPAEWGP